MEVPTSDAPQLLPSHRLPSYGLHAACLLSAVQELLPAAAGDSKNPSQSLGMSSSSRVAADVLSMTFLAAFAGPALAWAVLRDPWWLWLLAGLFGVNALVAGIKEATRGTRATWLKRPVGAVGCDAFCIGGAASREPGFPSGHMTTVVLVVVGAWLRLQRPWVLLVGVPWIVAMAWARQAKRCHTLLQVLAGAGLGATAAIGLAAARGLPVLD